MYEIGDFMSCGVTVSEACADLGERLKRLRLNKNLTQGEVALRVGVSRGTIIELEKGQATLETLVSVLFVLGQEHSISLLVPDFPYSPIQILKLKGKQRRRASGKHNDDNGEDLLGW